MNVDAVIEILEASTRTILKPEGTKWLFLPAAPVLNEFEREKFERLVDVYFCVVAVDVTLAEEYAAAFSDEWCALMAEVGVVETYLQLAIILGNMELALRCLAFGVAAGLWSVMTPLSIGVPEGEHADELAKDGLVLINNTVLGL